MNAGALRPCLMAGGCPREAVLTARIRRVGERVPEWRQRGLARDLTGSLR